MNKLIPLVVLSSLALAGCYRVTVRSNAIPAGPPIEKKAHVFLFGLVGGDVDVGCTPAMIETKRGFLDWFVGGLSLGLYTPQSTSTYCAMPQQQVGAR